MAAIQDSGLGMDTEWEDANTVEVLDVQCVVSEAMVDHAMEAMETEGTAATHQAVVTAMAAMEVQTTVMPHITDKIAIRIINKLALVLKSTEAQIAADK